MGVATALPVGCWGVRCCVLGEPPAPNIAAPEATIAIGDLGAWIWVRSAVAVWEALVASLRGGRLPVDLGAVRGALLSSLSMSWLRPLLSAWLQVDLTAVRAALCSPLSIRRPRLLLSAEALRARLLLPCFDRLPSARPPPSFVALLARC